MVKYWVDFFQDSVLYHDFALFKLCNVSAFLRFSFNLAIVSVVSTT